MFHIIGNGTVSGGIDVFLAITGFLAIPSLMRRTGDGWYIGLAARFSGLIRRLLIPLLPVALFVGIAGTYLIPLSEQPQLFSELRASILFYENWELVNSQLEYEAAGPETSPLQHIWSTSIQGQFHVAMTFLVMLVAFLAVKAGRSKKGALIAVLSLLTIASFWWATIDTSTSQASAYFSTASRAWELTLPGILGLIVSDLKISRWVRGIMSWVGLGLIVSCGFVVDGANLFPGPAALWPILGICLVLAAGETKTAWGADRLLVTWPFQKVGDISYSLYLWHWPFLIFALQLTGLERMDLPTGIAVIAASFIAGALGKYIFEDRVANWSFAFPHPRRALATGVATGVVSALLATGAIATSNTKLNDAIDSYRDSMTLADHPGAGAMVAPDYVEIEPMQYLPDRSIGRNDYGWNIEVHLENECIQRTTSSSTIPCEHPTANDGPLVIMVGSSHTGQWSDPIGDLAERYGWDLVLYEKSGCLFTQDPEINSAGLNVTGSCAKWNDNMLDVIEELQPDLVITTGTSRLGNDPEQITDGMIEAITAVEDLGIPVYLFRENLYRTDDIAECLAASVGDQVNECGQPREMFYDPDIDTNGAPYSPENVRMFDTSKYTCNETECFGIVGNVSVLRDENHLSATFANSAIPFIEEDMTDFIPELFTNPVDVAASGSSDSDG